VDEDDPFWLKEFTGTTYVHPVGLAMLLLLGIATLFVPRKYAVVPALILACFVPSAQRIAIFTLDFNFVRCMVLFGIARVFMRGETKGVRWGPLDYAVLAWGIFSLLVFTAQRGSFGALVNRLGYSFEALGLYFFFRCVIRDWRDIKSTTMAFIGLTLPLLAFFAVERSTRHNLFSVFGGVPDITRMRQGRIRCQGAFSHPILAGCFVASFIPLIGAMWFQGGVRKMASAVGLFTSLAIIFLCASSTPVAAVLFALMACALYPFRNMVGYVRWGVVCVLVALHMVMKAPVWHLVARIDIVGGSTGWHRFNLLDKAIRNWDEWLLLGKTSTANWDVFDITNEYVLNAIRGGGLTLAMLLLILYFGFRSVGRVVKATERDRPTNILAWALGASLFAHAMSFFSVSYYGQIVMVWYLHLAMIGSMAALVQTRPLRRAAPVSARPDGSPGPRRSAPNPVAGSLGAHAPFAYHKPAERRKAS